MIRCIKIFICCIAIGSSCNNGNEGLFFGYNIIFTEDLSLEKVKFKTSQESLDAGSRGIFTEGNYVYKIWDVNYSRCQTFIEAVKAGYFDAIAKISSIVFDRSNNCRGYVIPRGEIIDLEQLATNGDAYYEKNDRNCYSDWHIKDDGFELLLNSLGVLLDKLGYVFIDFSPSNIIKIDTAFYIIDLDSVFFVHEVIELYRKKKGLFDFLLSCMPLGYRKMVWNYIEQKLAK